MRRSTEYERPQTDIRQIILLDLSLSIIRSIAELAQALDIQSVAEGIETQSQIDYLCQVHTDLVQGYYFSKPLPIPEFEAWAAGFHFPGRSAPETEQTT